MNLLKKNWLNWLIMGVGLILFMIGEWFWMGSESLMIRDYHAGQRQSLITGLVMIVGLAIFVVGCYRDSRASKKSKENKS